MFKELLLLFKSKMELIERIRELESRCPSINNIIHKDDAHRDDNWHLIVSTDGIETWVRPNHVTYISPISQSDSYFIFSAIIDGCMTPLSFKSKDAATEFRNILLNVNTIPESNTYETKREPFTIMKEYETQIMGRKKITQEDIDSMQLRNKPNR